jgi:vitamin B12/bleomycin/antimicrobial peptide transport system ATP-binding/permease protein
MSVVGRIAVGGAFARRAWALAAPYWGSEERWRARATLAIIVILTLVLVFLNVLFNNWTRDFYEALQNKDFASFGPLLLRFGILATLYIIGAVIQLYLTMMLQMRWRIWLTRRFLERWLSNRIFYRLELRPGRTDNPDQRIQEDLRMFTFNSISLVLGLLSSVTTLVSFVTILWVISGPISVPLGSGSLEIPGFMVWVALVYAIIGSVLTHAVGRPLIPLNYQQQRVEADLRFGLVRLRENAEGVALYNGQAFERRDLDGRIDRIRANWWQLMRYTKNLTIFTTGYDQLANVFPLLVAAPQYFTGVITLGVLSQISNAFGQVQGSLSWFVLNYGSLASWKASVDRLLTFEDEMNRVSLTADAPNRIQVLSDGTEAQAIRADGLELRLPNGRVLLPDTTFAFRRGDRVLVTGPTGVGKSTLFRAIAGIWPYGSGDIEEPADARILFLPQKPYLPIASVRDTVSYPAPGGTFTDSQVRAVLADTGLEQLADHLDEVDNWANRLSLGEQQRLAVARALLHQPQWVFLDEATAALDETAEKRMYRLLTERLPDATIVSIAHRPEVAQFHNARYAVTRGGVVSADSQASIQTSR